MKLGFIGTGALTSAIVIGLKSLDGDPVSVVLSPRNEEIAAKLASRYPNTRVAADNQEVLDDCDTVPSCWLSGRKMPIRCCLN